MRAILSEAFRPIAIYVFTFLSKNKKLPGILDPPETKRRFDPRTLQHHTQIRSRLVFAQTDCPYANYV